MEYKIIFSSYYNENKNLCLKLIEELFKNDNDKLANIDEIKDHLQFIFNQQYDFNSFLIFQISNDKLISMVNAYEYDKILHEWCIFSLFTKKEFRKMGYAEKILRLAVEKIQKYNCSKIIVGIEENNTSSIKLHEKVGFKYANCNWDELAEGFPKNHLGYYYEVK